MEQLASDVRRQLIARVANEMIREVVAQGQTATMEVVGHSMWPLLCSGDVITVRSVAAEELRPGILVVCMQADGSFLAHRLLGVLPDGRLLTRGDARPKADPPWPPHSLVGQVVAAERAGRPVKLDEKWPFWAGRVRAWWTASYRVVRRLLKGMLTWHVLPLLACLLCLCLRPSARAAVTLLYFTAEPEPDAILLRWETASELNTSAFRIYRALSASGPWDTWIHQQAAAGDVVGTAYQYRDPDVTPGVTYYYLLEEIETDDNHIRYMDRIVSATIGQQVAVTPTPSVTATLTQTFIATLTPTASPIPTATPTASPSRESYPHPTATRRYTNTPPVVEATQASPRSSVAVVTTSPPQPTPSPFPLAWVATPTTSGELQPAGPATTNLAAPTHAPHVGSSPTPGVATAPPIAATPPFPSAGRATPELARPSALVTSTHATRMEAAALALTVTPSPVIPSRPEATPRLILWLGSGALGGAVLLGLAALYLSRRTRDRV